MDPAGLIAPAYPLQRAMRRAALAVIEGADLVCTCTRSPTHPAPPLERLLPDARAVPATRLAVYTKADLVPAARRPALEAGALAVVGGDGRGRRRRSRRGSCSRSPTARSSTTPTTSAPSRCASSPPSSSARPSFGELRQELPYAVAVQIDTFREAETGVYIRATLAVERDSQKPIVLGKGGRTIKAVGIAARARIAAFLDRPVHLDLWVTVWPKWRADAARLSELGLPITQGERPMTLPKDLLEILVCPKCKGELEYRTAPSEELVCRACRLRYAVDDGIPIMLIDEAKPL